MNIEINENNYKLELKKCLDHNGTYFYRLYGRNLKSKELIFEIFKTDAEARNYLKHAFLTAIN